MCVLTFRLDCIPTPQIRTRIGVVNGHGMAFHSKKQKGNEATLDALLAEHRPGSPLIGPVELSVTAVMPIPKSWSKKARQAAIQGRVWHTKKPDMDNLMKQIKDAMTRLRYWEDDKQVCHYGDVGKIYGENPGWEVSVKTLEDQDNGNA